MVLSTIIRILHIMIIVFILIAPFANEAPILILHITGAWCLLVHWVANNDVCFLTLMEGKLRGIDYKKGFLHQFVAPVYNISSESLSKLSYIVVLTSMMISLYHLVETQAFQNAKKCHDNGGSWMDCIKILFKKEMAK